MRTVIINIKESYLNGTRIDLDCREVIITWYSDRLPGLGGQTAADPNYRPNWILLLDQPVGGEYANKTIRGPNVT